MADVRVRNADNVVLEAALDGTLVAGAGETIFTEAATFIPSWNDVTYERTGVSTYNIIDSTTGPLDDANDPINAGTAVAVTASDTTPSGLDDAIVDGTGITTTILNPGADEQIQISVDPSAIDHNALLNYVANEHIDHSSVSVVAGGDDGLAVVNNDLTANIGLAVDINGTTALGAAPDAADQLLIWDDSAAALRSITITNLLASVSANDTVCFNGGIRDVDANESVNATWGHNRAGAGPVMATAGNIVSFSVSDDQPMTAGSIDVRVSINGIAQNGAGQVITLVPGSNQTEFLVLGAPIAVAAGDVIDVGAIADGALTPNNHDLTVTVCVQI